MASLTLFMVKPADQTCFGAGEGRDLRVVITLRFEAAFRRMFPELRRVCKTGFSILAIRERVLHLEAAEAHCFGIDEFWPALSALSAASVFSKFECCGACLSGMLLRRPDNG